MNRAKNPLVWSPLFFGLFALSFPSPSSSAGKNPAVESANESEQARTDIDLPVAESPGPSLTADLPEPSQKTSDQVPKPNLLLTKVIAGRATGFQFEKEEVQSRVRKQARIFADFKKQRLPKGEQAALVSECRKNATLSPAQHAQFNPFCKASIRFSDFLERKGKGGPLPTEKGVKLSRQAQKRIRSLMLQGDLKGLAQVREAEYLGTKNLLPPMQELSKLIRAVLETKSCPSANLAATLAMRSEEKFPDPVYRNQAILLYNRAIECGEAKTASFSALVAATRSRFRIGLIQIWEERWEEAEKALSKISEPFEGNDYASRALYWRAYAARRGITLEKQKLAEQLTQRLTAEYSHSLHGLITLGSSKPNEPALTIDPAPVQISTRSAKYPEYNPWIRGIEALIEIGAFELVDDLLLSNIEELRKLENPVKLYTAALLNRSEHHLLAFRLLQSWFKESTRAKSAEVLKLFYPMKNFPTIVEYSRDTDPYLVLSLIRQESGFNQSARSRVGALGLMQLMPRTARRLERVPRHMIADPRTNIRLGVKYFSQLIEQFDGDAELALAGYNAGPERAEVWQKRYPVKDRLLFLDLIPFKETREYVASITRNYYWYRRLYPEQTPQGMISAVPDSLLTTTLQTASRSPAKPGAGGTAQRSIAQAPKVRPRLPIFEAYPVLAATKK